MVDVDCFVLVSLTVVVRVIVLRVVEATSLPLAGTGWARPVEECESPAPGAEAGTELSGPGVTPGGDCPSDVCPFSAGGGADPCPAATCELSAPGMAWFCATWGISPPLSVGKAGGGVDDPEAFNSVSVLYSDALVWPYSIDVVASWDPIDEPEGGTSWASPEETIVDEDGGGAPLLGASALGLLEDAGFSVCFSEPSLGGLIVDEDGAGALLSGTGALGLLGDAVCEDCSCDPSLGGMIVDKDCDDGGALSDG